MAWSPTNLPKRTGVYTRFVDQTEPVPQGGPRGIVAIPLRRSDGTAEEKQVYTVERISEAIELFGAENIDSIRLAFQHGANKVLVYTLPADITDFDYSEMFDQLITHDFNVFVLDQDPDSTLQADVRSFVQNAAQEGKHFFVVFGGTAQEDEDPELGNERSNSLKHEYVINLINGVVQGEKRLTSAEFAPAIAGLVAGNPLNQTITYKTVQADDVTRRLKNSEFEAAIEAGSLALLYDGGQVKVEKGITTSGDNIRSIQTRHAILNDIPRMLRSQMLAQVDNSEDGRASVRAFIMRYLETLGQNGVINMDPGNEPAVYDDPDNPPTEDAAFFVIEYTDQYSMERIFLTVVRR